MEVIRAFTNEAVEKFIPALIPIAKTLSQKQIEKWNKYQDERDKEFIENFGKGERGEILGNVIGNIVASSINVEKNAYIRRDLTYLNTISISEGGEVHGLIRRVSQSKTKSADSDKIRYIDQSKKISNI